MDIMERTK
ncbi:hypothetical protein HU200_047885 [Digitaria exilis]|uniref:Uncharacterized protein n=1 Tax=Digitaria exilis TaxID=1010633 RepID=A0A835AXB7_9POAL|nr:hypothetical protein HU200_047885 [Digitaria exilis]